MKPVLVFVLSLLSISEVFAQSLKTNYTFRKYLLENVRYPEGAVQKGIADRAYAFFEVGADGKVTKVRAACGQRGLGFEKAIEQALLAAPAQGKSAMGRYLVRFEFNLPVGVAQNRSNEVMNTDTLSVPEGTVALYTVKIEAIVATPNIGEKTQSVEAEKANTRFLSSSTEINALTYTTRKAEREYKLKSKKTGKEIGAITVSYEYPVFNEEYLNDVLRAKFIQKNSFEAAAEAYIEEKKRTFSAFKEEDFGLSGFGQGYSLSLKVSRQNSRFVFFKANWSENNEGAAHGQYGEVHCIYDRQTRRMLNLDDMLIAGGRNELRSIAERTFRQAEKLSANASLCDNYLFDKCRFELAENFTVTETSLDFMYNPYEGKSFAMGIWSLKIPYGSVKSLINPAYGALFDQTAMRVISTPKDGTGTLSSPKKDDGRYSGQITRFDNDQLPQRMKNLMGETSFAKVISYFQVEKLVQFYDGRTLIVGCKSEDCDKYESVVFVDLGLNKIYVGMLDNDKVQTWSDSPAFKNYDPTSMPADFKEWFLEASRKAREQRGTASKKMEKHEKVFSERNADLSGANSPEELAKMLLQALKNNDLKTWMRYMHSDSKVENDEESMRRFEQHRECLSQRGVSNWTSVVYSRMTYNLRPSGGAKVDPATTIPAIRVEFSYQNKEFFGSVHFGTFVKYEGKWRVWFSGSADECEVTRYQRN